VAFALKKNFVPIPKEIRDALGIKIGDILVVRKEGKRIILEPMVKRDLDPLEAILNLVKKPLDIDAVKLVEESWEEDLY